MICEQYTGTVPLLGLDDGNRALSRYGVDGVDVVVYAGLVEGIAEREVSVHVTAIKYRFFTLYGWRMLQPGPRACPVSPDHGCTHLDLGGRYETYIVNV